VLLCHGVQMAHTVRLRKSSPSTAARTLRLFMHSYFIVPDDDAAPNSGGPADTDVEKIFGTG